MRTLLSLGIALLTACSHAQVVPALPGDWFEHRPFRSEQELYCANRAWSEWRVSLQGGVLDVRPLERGERAETTRIAFADGDLVGIDSGEWGGALLWRPTGAPAVQLLADNTRYIFVWNEKVFAAGGLAHLSLSDGYIAQLEPANGGWRVARRTDLSGPVSAVDYSSPDEVILATSDGIHKMDATGGVRRVFTSSNWWAQYPNSVVRLQNGDILVGMRYSISRLRPNADGYVETLLLPSAVDTCHLPQTDENPH